MKIKIGKSVIETDEIEYAQENLDGDGIKIYLKSGRIIDIAYELKDTDSDTATKNILDLIVVSDKKARNNQT